MPVQSYQASRFGLSIYDVAALDTEFDSVTPPTIFVEEGQYRGAVSCAAVLVPTGDPHDPWWAIAFSAASPTFARKRHDLTGAPRTAGADLAA